MIKMINMKKIISIIIYTAQFAFAQAPDVAWTRNYGGNSYDFGNSVKQTFDGGFIIAGSTESNGAGDKDVWLIRTDSLGNVLWSKTFGGTNLDEGTSVWQNSDGGFIITGQSRSFPADSVDILLIRTDELGNALWTKLYGGPSLQIGTCVQQTKDGGFIVSGYTIVDSLFHSNALLLHVDSAGNHAMFIEYDRGDYDYAESVVQTISGGYAFCGRTAPASVTYDAWLLVTDASGNVITDKTYGGNESEYASSIQGTYDGGYIISGTSYSFGAGGADFYLIRTNSSGDTLWTKTYGGSATELSSSVIQTSDSGFALTGYTNSFGGGSADVWVVRTTSLGDTLWTKTIGVSSYEQGKSVQQTSDGGYIITGYTTEFGFANAYLIKLDSIAALPVELTSFSANANEKSVELKWITATEINNYGFEIERNPSLKPFQSEGIQSAGWDKIGFVNGHGNSTSIKQYSFEDKLIINEKVKYRLKQIDFDGTFKYSSEIEVDASVPDKFALYQNYPNPFNPVTKIKYSIPTVGTSLMKLVQLKVYDILGREVTTLVNKQQQPGAYEVTFDGSHLASGLYFYQLKTSHFVQTKKLVLLK